MGAISGNRIKFNKPNLKVIEKRINQGEFTKETYLYSAWQTTYLCMSLVMLVGLVTALVVKEPKRQSQDERPHTTQQYARFLGLFIVCIGIFIGAYILSADVITSLKSSIADWTGNNALGALIGETIRLSFAIAMVVFGIKLLDKVGLVERDLVRETYLNPVKDFFSRYGLKLAILLLAFIGLYRISDIVLGVISNVFFQEIGYSKEEIATVVKTFGLFMTIAGGFLGGVLSIRFGVMKMLFVGALLTVTTNLLFMVLASQGYNIGMLYLVISADNLAAGLASAAFIAFLSSLTNVSFTAVQYAIFSSLMTLLPKVIGGYSGGIVENVGYSSFFLIASLMGMPVLVLIYFVNKHLLVDENGASAV